MNKEKLIQQMLYDKSHDDILKEIDNIYNCETLYVYAYNYNWDNGFRILEKIINKECCDLSTALMIFYKSDGISYLQEKNCKNENENENDWLSFIEKLYITIINNKYKKSIIKFVPPLSKVQMYKLKKTLNPKEEVFIEEIGTDNFNIDL